MHRFTDFYPLFYLKSVFGCIVLRKDSLLTVLHSKFDGLTIRHNRREIMPRHGGIIPPISILRATTEKCLIEKPTSIFCLARESNQRPHQPLYGLRERSNVIPRLQQEATEGTG